MDLSNLKLKELIWAGYYYHGSLSWSAKNRTTHIVGIQLNGSCLHNFDNKVIKVDKNHLYFFNQKDDYSAHSESNNCLSLSMHFTTYEPITTESFSISLKNPSEIISLLEKIRRKTLTPTLTSEVECLSCFYQIFTILNKVKHKSYAQSDTRVSSSMDFIDKNFLNDDCLELAIKQSSLSRRRFNFVFKKQNNFSPYQYIISLRIEHAQQLLLTSDLSITRISELCGFSDVYYFSKAFRKSTGVCPSRFRKLPID